MAISTTLESGIDGTLGTQRRRSAVSSLTSAPAGTVTTYFYFTAGGAVGSTSDPAAVPSTAGIVRTVTT